MEHVLYLPEQLCVCGACACPNHPAAAVAAAGMLHTIGGLTKFRRPEDMREVALEGLNAFDAAILAHQQRALIEIPQCT